MSATGKRELQCYINKYILYVTVHVGTVLYGGYVQQYTVLYCTGGPYHCTGWYSSYSTERRGSPALVIQSSRVSLNTLSKASSMGTDSPEK